MTIRLFFLTINALSYDASVVDDDQDADDSYIVEAAQLLIEHFE
jgi:hypothetical protein